MIEYADPTGARSAPNSFLNVNSVISLIVGMRGQYRLHSRNPHTTVLALLAGVWLGERGD